MRYVVMFLFVLAGVLFLCGMVQFVLSGGGGEAASLSAASSLLGIMVSCIFD